MKKLIILACLLTVGSILKADDTVYVEDFQLPINGEADLVVRFHFDTSGTYSGYQFRISLPENIEFLVKSNGTPVYMAGDCYDETPSITPNIVDGVLNVGCFTANADPIEPTDGTLVTFKVKVGEDYSIGQSLSGVIDGIKLSDESGGSTISVDKFSFTITIAEPDDGRIKFDETSAVLPTYTAGEKGNVRMKRTIKAGEWSTLVLPFTLTKAKAEAAFGSDVQLAEFSGFEAVYADDDDVTPDAINVTFTTYTMSARKSLVGGYPYLIKTSKDITEFEADDVTLAGVVSAVEKQDGNNTRGRFTGTLVPTKVPADGLFISGTQFWYSTGATNIKAFRCWLDLGAVLDKETDFGAKVAFVVNDEELSAIDGVSLRSIPQTGIYNLQGQKVADAGSPTDKLPRGIYVVGGKKIVVK